MEMNKSALALLAISARRSRGDEYVPVPRIDNFYIRAVLLDLFAKFECYIQVDILLFGNFSHCTRVVSTVSGVYNDNKVFRFSAANCKRGR